LVIYFFSTLPIELKNWDYQKESSVLGQVAGLSKTCSIQQRIGEEYKGVLCKGVQVFSDERIKTD
jgi:hypothetical protein